VGVPIIVPPLLLAPRLLMSINAAEAVDIIVPETIANAAPNHKTDDRDRRFGKMRSRSIASLLKGIEPSAKRPSEYAISRIDYSFLPEP
jgi:hypothetical protein